MIETIAVIASLGLIVTSIRLLAPGADQATTVLFPSQLRLEWPRGVQEEDVPRFVFRG
jgi:hypothetical protein